MHSENLRLVGAIAVGLAAGGALSSTADVRSAARDQLCGTTAKTQQRTTLYFGMSRPKGAVSELEWQIFLRDEVTPRFPDGLTSWDVIGQWQSQGTIGQERSKVLLLVHPDGRAADEAVQALIARYRKSFDQESVLWETARVCASS